MLQTRKIMAFHILCKRRRWLDLNSYVGLKSTDLKRWTMEIKNREQRDLNTQQTPRSGRELKTGLNLKMNKITWMASWCRIFKGYFKVIQSFTWHCCKFSVLFGWVLCISLCVTLSRPIWIKERFCPSLKIRKLVIDVVSNTTNCSLQKLKACTNTYKQT